VRPGTPAVFAEDLWRSHGRQPVLCGAGLAVPQGRCLAVLGANGAGKSTLLRVLAGALRPRRGRVRLAGEDPFAVPEARRRLGFAGHEPMLYGGLTVLENLRLFARLYGLPDGAARAARAAALLRVDRPDALVRTLSRGGRQRAALARAVVHDPEVLLLDEPFTGLDPSGVDDLGRILREFCRAGGTAVLTTHSAAEAVLAADHAAVLARGRLSAPRPLDGAGAEGLRRWYGETVEAPAG
jgi:heme ABC exporter ATP-binding subunit CcmA